MGYTCEHTLGDTSNWLLLMESCTVAMPTRAAIHPKTARREEKSEKKKEEAGKVEEDDRRSMNAKLQ